MPLKKPKNYVHILRIVFFATEKHTEMYIQAR